MGKCKIEIKEDPKQKERERVKEAVDFEYQDIRVVNQHDKDNEYSIYRGRAHTVYDFVQVGCDDDDIDKILDEINFIDNDAYQYIDHDIKMAILRKAFNDSEYATDEFVFVSDNMAEICQKLIMLDYSIYIDYATKAYYDIDNDLIEPEIGFKCNKKVLKKLFKLILKSKTTDVYVDFECIDNFNKTYFVRISNPTKIIDNHNKCGVNASDKDLQDHVPGAVTPEYIERQLNLWVTGPLTDLINKLCSK